MSSLLPNSAANITAQEPAGSLLRNQLLPCMVLRKRVTLETADSCNTRQGQKHTGHIKGNENLQAAREDAECG